MGRESLQTIPLSTIGDLGNLGYAKIKGVKETKGAECVPIKGVNGGRGGQ